MRQITMDPVAFVFFQKLANFMFEFAVCKGQVIVTAEAHHLEELGF